MGNACAKERDWHGRTRPTSGLMAATAPAVTAKSNVTAVEGACHLRDKSPGTSPSIIHPEPRKVTASAAMRKGGDHVPP